MNDSQNKSAGKKPKLVRDSFTIPKAEYAAIDALKARALKLGVGVKKSELLRAGLMLLQQMSDERLKAAMASVPTIKTGRPLSLKVETRVAPAVVKKPATKPALASAPAPVKAAVKKAVVKKVAVKKAVAKKVTAKAAPATAAVKASPTPKPVVQAPTPKPAAQPPVAPAAKGEVQPAKKVVAKKATAPQA